MIRFDPAYSTSIFFAVIATESFNLYDDHAIEISRLLDPSAEVLTRSYFTVQRDDGVNHEHLAVFAAAVLWRASVSTYRELRQFSLDAEEQERFRATAF